MKKKILVLVLSLLMVTTSLFTLIGCAQKEDDKINVFGISSGVSDADFNKHEVATMIKDYTKTDVTFFQSAASAADAENQINAIFQLKQDYHAITVTKQQFYSLMAQGGLYDLTDLVKNTTNLKNAEVIGDEGWKIASSGGKKYGIPHKDARPQNIVAIAYRQDFLTAYNEQAAVGSTIAVPSEANGYAMTTSNYKKYLQFVNDTYVGLNKPVSGKPLRIDKDNPLVEPVMTAFGLYQIWADVDQNKTLEYMTEQPGFSDYLDYMNELHAAGLVEYQTDAIGVAASLQISSDKNISVAASGRVAHWNPASYEGAAGNEKFAYISALVPDAKGENDATMKSAVRYHIQEGYSYFTVIPKHVTAHKAKLVMNYIDKKLDKEFFLKQMIGEEGVHHKIVDGEYYPIIPKFDERNIADKFTNGTREQDYAKAWMCRVRKTDAQYKMFSRANYNYENAGIKSPIMVMPPNDVFDKYFSPRNSRINAQMILNMFPAAGTARVSADSIKTLFKTGTVEGSAKTGAEITTAVNGWYTAWANSDGANYNPVKPRT